MGSGEWRFDGGFLLTFSLPLLAGRGDERCFVLVAALVEGGERCLSMLTTTLVTNSQR
jgi:hypothetical protein